MALQLGALRDALIDAGASEAKAAQAAEELAAYDHRFDGVERRLDQIDHKIDFKVDGLRSEMNERFAEVDKRFADVAGRFNRMDWMMGTLIVLVLAILGRLLLIH